MCAERVRAASLPAAADDRGPAGCKDPGQRHPGRPAPGELPRTGAQRHTLYGRAINCVCVLSLFFVLRYGDKEGGRGLSGGVT